MEWDDLRAIDKYHHLEAILTNPAYRHAAKTIREAHLNAAVYGPDAASRESSRQHVLAVDELDRFFQDQMSVAREAMRGNEPDA
jgi:hypothetical protein